jgi:alpha-D-ribose 1-methylphosphonate 5-phosphate C-P lyase
MTADERRSLVDDRKSETRDKVLKDFAEYGITQTMIYEAIGKE